MVAARSVGDAGAIRRTYESGLTLGGGGGLASIPVFDTTGIYGENTTNYHMQWYHFAARDRLVRANGNADNEVMWRGNPVPAETAWSLFEQWVTAYKSDTSGHSDRTKVIGHKPAAAVDGCWTLGSWSTFIQEPQTLSSLPNTQCNMLYPGYLFPRYIAGGPINANVLKCRLKPLDPGDYAVTLTATEWNRLHEIFPTGVCDWSKSGHEQVPNVPWASFGPSPVNRVFDVTRHE